MRQNIIWVDLPFFFDIPVMFLYKAIFFNLKQQQKCLAPKILENTHTHLHTQNTQNTHTCQCMYFNITIIVNIVSIWTIFLSLWWGRFSPHYQEISLEGTLPLESSFLGSVSLGNKLIWVCLYLNMLCGMGLNKYSNSKIKIFMVVLYLRCFLIRERQL